MVICGKCKQQMDGRKLKKHWAAEHQEDYVKVKKFITDTTAGKLYHAETEVYGNRPEED